VPVKNKNEFWYTFVKIVGVMLNFSIITWYAIEYYFLCLHDANLENTVAAKMTMDLLMLLCCLIFADSLRRIYMHVQKQQGMVSNLPALFLHLGLCVLYLGSNIGKSIAIKNKL